MTKFKIGDKVKVNCPSYCGELSQSGEGTIIGSTKITKERGDWQVELKANYDLGYYERELELIEENKMSEMEDMKLSDVSTETLKKVVEQREETEEDSTEYRIEMIDLEDDDKFNEAYDMSVDELKEDYTLVFDERNIQIYQDPDCLEIMYRVTEE